MTRNMRRKSNLRDVARAAGVSAATVSRVLTGSAPVSQDIRTRVEQAIEDLQFVPSSAARAINSGRTRLIGALIPTLDHAIFARFLAHVEDTLAEHGLSLIVANTGSLPDQELEKARKLLDLGVEALLVSGTRRAEGFDALVKRHDVPVIATSCYRPDYAYPTIGYDNGAVARSALAHLVSLGHQQVAVLSGPSANNDRTQDRLQALKDDTTVELKFAESELSFAGARAALRDVLRTAPDITAVLCLSDVLAHGALLELRQSSVDQAQNVSVIGIDDLPASAHFDPPLTTVHLPVGQMGIAAAEAIADWVERGKAPDHIQLETQLMLRASTHANVET